jgi:lysozyme
MRVIPQAALDLVTRWEGLELTAYPDPATGGDPWTIGYGHTRGVRLGQTVTKGQALTFLRTDLQVSASLIQQRIGAVIDELTDNQYAALLSFVFNLGADPKWTIWKRIKGRQFDLVPNEINRFVFAAGKRMQGLANRRAAEVALWRTGEPNTLAENPPSSITRLMDTSPISADPTPPHKSAAILTGIATVIAGGPAMVKGAIEAVQPYAVFSPQVTTIMGVLGAIGAVFAVANLAHSWWKKREARR